MDKIKVLHILNTGSYSGAEKVVISIISSTRKYVDSVYASLDGNIEVILNENNIEFISLAKLNIANIKKAIGLCKPDIIHAHDYTASIFAAASTLGIPIISHLHNNAPWIRIYCLKSFIYGISCIRYKKVLGVSNSIFDEYIFRELIRSKWTNMTNPVDIEKIRKTAQESSEKCGYDILFLGRLSTAKNPMYFLEIINQIRKVNPEITVGIIGNGELEDNVKNKIIELNLENMVTLLGFKRNPYGILSASRILCITSSWEGFGLVAVESLALGIPAVVSSVGGLKYIIDNNCGKLCEDIYDFIDEIELLLQNSEYYQLKASSANNKALQFDNTLAYMNNLMSLYNDIHQNRKRV